MLCVVYEVSGGCGACRVLGGLCVACDVRYVCGMVSAVCLWCVLCAVCQCGMVCGLSYYDLFLKHPLDYEYDLVPELRARQLNGRNEMGSLRQSLPAQHPPIAPALGRKTDPSLALQLLDHQRASLPLACFLSNTHSRDIQVIPCLLAPHHSSFCSDWLSRGHPHAPCPSGKLGITPVPAALHFLDKLSSGRAKGRCLKTSGSVPTPGLCEAVFSVC